MVIQILQSILLATLLVIASVFDIRKRIIPNKVCILVALTGFVCFEPLNLLGIFCGLPFLIAALTIGGIYGGDIKLMAAAGLVLGFWNGITAMIISLTVMLIFYPIFKLIIKLQGKSISNITISKTAFPLAPFLTVGILTIYYINIIS